MNMYFGPLNKEWCNYFLVLTIISFGFLVFLVFTEILYIFKNFRTINFRAIISGVTLVINLFLAYIFNRLLYTMCNKSIV